MTEHPPMVRAFDTGVDVVLAPDRHQAELPNLSRAHDPAAERPALIEAETGRSLTHPELAHHAENIAASLWALGLRHGDVLATMLPNDVEHWLLIAGAMQIGIRVAPLPTTLITSEAEWMLTDCGASAVATTAAVADLIEGLRIPTLKARITHGPRLGWTPLSDLSTMGAALPRGARAAGIMMHYTSGTTGRPKAVFRPLPPGEPAATADLMAATYREIFQLPSEGTALAFGPPHHAAPCAFAWAMLSAGYTVILQDGFNAEAALIAIATYRVTVIQTVPTHLFRLLHSSPSLFDVSSLAAILVAGAPFSRLLRSDVVATFGPIVWEYYGATEGFVCAISPREAEHHPTSVGRPRDVVITDDAGTPLEVNRPGLIWFRMPEESSFRYLTDAPPGPLLGDAYATCGDIGSLDAEGYLSIADRRTDLLISGGVNVSPVAVEEVVRGAPGVFDAMVVGVPDLEWGERIVALVRRRYACAMAEAVLAGYIRSRLTAPQRPRAVLFVDEVPVSRTGKPDRNRGREIALTRLAAAAPAELHSLREAS